MSHFVFSYVVFVWKSNGIIHIAALGILQMHNFCNLSKFSNLKHAFSFIFFFRSKKRLYLRQKLPYFVLRRVKLIARSSLSGSSREDDKSRRKVNCIASS